jgi:isopenicillin-N N-acyltransferase-like protein
LILGVGDGKLQEFRGFQYSYSILNVVDDDNLIPANDTWHPKIENVVYWGMDWYTICQKNHLMAI